MKKFLAASPVIILLVLLSCSSKGPVYEKYFKFEHNTWDRFKQVLFNIPFEESDAEYDISIVLKPVADFPYDDMPIYVIMNTPAGEERMTEVKVHLKEKGAFIGATEGKPVIIKAPLWKALAINDKGTCKISIENMVPKIQTTGIAEVGIVVEKAVKQ
jgi:gliding motility-associated lipoprotein GldH